MCSAGFSFFEGVDESFGACAVDGAPKYEPMERFMVYCQHIEGIGSEQLANDVGDAVP